MCDSAIESPLLQMETTYNDRQNNPLCSTAGGDILKSIYCEFAYLRHKKGQRLSWPFRYSIMLLTVKN
jgi:hypothetical protein